MRCNIRLWHEALIQRLDRQRILGQHRECCALRGLGWGKKHATVDYVFKHQYSKLYTYHVKIMQEIKRRGYKVAPEWLDQNYRGKRLGYDYSGFTKLNDFSSYDEHNEEYLNECLKNLKRKGVL